MTAEFQSFAWICENAEDRKNKTISVELIR